MGSSDDLMPTGTSDGTENPASSLHLSNSSHQSFGHSKYILSLLFSLRLEAQKLVYLAAKEHKESTMLEAYRSLMMQDTIVMSEDVRSEHVAGLEMF